METNFPYQKNLFSKIPNHNEYVSTLGPWLMKWLVLYNWFKKLLLFQMFKLIIRRWKGYIKICSTVSQPNSKSVDPTSRSVTNNSQSVNTTSTSTVQVNQENKGTSNEITSVIQEKVLYHKEVSIHKVLCQRRCLWLLPKKIDLRPPDVVLGFEHKTQEIKTLFLLIQLQHVRKCHIHLLLF